MRKRRYTIFMKKIMLAGVMGVLMLPYFVFAGPVVRGGDSVSVDATQVLEGDFYALGSTVQVSGSANEDVYIAGGKVTLNGITVKDLTVFGGTVGVHGTVGDDVRVLGGDVILAGAVGGDVVVIGGSLSILSTAEIKGDVLFWGGDLTIEGVVQGVVHGSSERLRINSRVGGVEYTVGRALELGDKAHVVGGLTHIGSGNLVRAQGAVVEGEVQRIERSVSDKGGVPTIIVTLGMLLFSALALYFVMRKTLAGMVTTTLHTFGFYGLVGIGAGVLIPILSVVLFASVLGVLAGVVLLLGYFALLVLSCVTGMILLGVAVQKYGLKKENFSVLTPVIGVVAALVLSVIPYIGGLLLFGLTMCAFGAYVHTLYRLVRRR